jgi:non-specific serine/threonine protein kinase
MGESRSGQLGNLPGEVTSFVGRQTMTLEVRRVLAASRLVTLTGVAGVGKTRLALHVAQECRRAFRDGVWLVELANLREPSMLEHLVAETLGLRETPERAPLAALTRHLESQTALLVMDNCEHVLDGCAHLLGELLPAAANVRVLATSREPLGIAGEHVWPVTPLALPEADASNVAVPAAQAEAVTLFEQRTAAVLPHFRVDAANKAAVAKVCHLLEGLPLAIELAAVRIRVLSVEELLSRLRNRYAVLSSQVGGSQRHRTLHDSVEWSFSLCSAQEQAAWARLSVFVGSFDLDAAEAVCTDAGLDTHETFDAVTGLVAKSVLTMEPVGTAARYRMLETIREYGREQLISRGDEATLRRRHRDHYLRLAEQAAAEWFGPDQHAWAARLRHQSANLRTALDYCFTEPNEAHAGLRMAGALWTYWIPCGNLLDGRSWLDRALATIIAPSLERAHALWANGYVATRQGDLHSALAMLNECRRLATHLGDAELAAHADSAAGLTLVFADQPLEARAALCRSLAYYDTPHATPDSPQALALFFLGYIDCLEGDIDGALARCQQCQALCEGNGERWAQSWALWGLGLARWLQGSLAEAENQLRSSLRIKHDFGDLSGVLLTAACMAWTSATGGAPERAARLLGATRTLWKPLGPFLYGHHAFLRWDRDSEARARSLLGDNTFEARYAEGAGFTMDSLAAYALDQHPSASERSGTIRSLSILTEREREVAELIAKGLSNKRIAERLIIAPRTVESHVEHILVKLGFTSRSQIATAWTRSSTEEHTSMGSHQYPTTST